MVDIFLGYARNDRARARHIVDVLEHRGWDVWWDRDILPSEDWDRAIQTRVQQARLVVVLWTRESVESDFVRIEAHIGRERGVLVPVLLDEVQIPAIFRLIQAALMSDWDGADNHPGFLDLLRGIEQILSVENGSRPSDARTRPNPSLPITQERFLDAAIAKALPVLQPANLIVMVRQRESEGLKAILEIETEYELGSEDVVSRQFQLDFPADYSGQIRRAEIELKIDSPGFRPLNQAKRIRVPPNGDSATCVFFLTPQVEGELMINLELHQQDFCLASRVFRVEGLSSQRRVPAARHLLVLPLRMVVAQEDAFPREVRATAPSMPTPAPASVSAKKRSSSAGWKFAIAVGLAAILVVPVLVDEFSQDEPAVTLPNVSNGGQPQVSVPFAFAAPGRWIMTPKDASVSPLSVELRADGSFSVQPVNSSAAWASTGTFSVDSEGRRLLVE